MRKLTTSLAALVLMLSAGSAAADAARDQAAAQLRSITPVASATVGGSPSQHAVAVKVLPIKDITAGQIAGFQLPIGARIGFQVTVSEPARVYILNLDAEGNLPLLFPNKFDDFFSLPESGDYLIPDPGADYSFQVGGPVGKDLIKVIAVFGDATAFEDVLASTFTQNDVFPRAISVVPAINAIDQFLTTTTTVVFTEATTEMNIVAH